MTDAERQTSTGHGRAGRVRLAGRAAGGTCPSRRPIPGVVSSWSWRRRSSWSQASRSPQDGCRPRLTRRTVATAATSSLVDSHRGP